MLECVSKAIAENTRDPLHLRIAKEIERAILAGDIDPGDRLPRNRDMSRTLGVSPMTVQGAIRTLSAQGLVVPRRGVGTFVADPIPAKVGRVAAVMMHEPPRDDTVLWRYLESIIQACSRHRLEVVVEFSSALGHDFGKLPETMERWRGFRAVLFLSPSPQLIARVDAMTRSPVRIVAIDVMSQAPIVSCFLSDNFAMCHDLAVKLHDLGHRRMDMVFHPDNRRHLQSVRRRIAGFEEAVRRLGLEETARATTFEELAARLDQRDRPTALILNIGVPLQNRVFDTLAGRGLAIPDDVSVIGYDAPGRTLADGRLIATIDQPRERLAEEAIRYLATGDEGRFTLTIPQTYVAGETVGQVP